MGPQNGPRYARVPGAYLGPGPGPGPGPRYTPGTGPERARSSELTAIKPLNWAPKWPQVRPRTWGHFGAQLSGFIAVNSLLLALSGPVPGVYLGPGPGPGPGPGTPQVRPRTWGHFGAQLSGFIAVNSLLLALSGPVPGVYLGPGPGP